MGTLLVGAIFIPDWAAIPWHENNVKTHLSYCPRLKETTLTLFTKDHQKIIKITDKEHAELATNYMRNNWSLECKSEWQHELKTLYQNMGD